MHGRGDWAVVRWKYLTAVLCQPKLGAEQTLRRSCPQADNELRTNGSNLRFQPWAAGRYFKRVWLLMQADLSAWFPFEMLNSIGDVDFGPIDPRGLEAFIKQLTGGPDERLPLQVFAIAGLLSHQEKCAMGSPFPKDGLCRFAIKIASLTLLRRFP